MTFRGMIGENIDGGATVKVMVGQQTFDATVQDKVFIADVSGAAEDDLITIVASYPASVARKKIVLKSYVGSFAQAKARKVEDTVSEEELPTLYINAISTVSAAFLEKSRGGAIETVSELLSASQLLPQEVLLESAIGLRYIVNGGSSALYTQNDSYSFLREYPIAAKVALELKRSSSQGMETYTALKNELVTDPKQISRVAGYVGNDMLFATAGTLTERVAGFAVNLSGGGSGAGQYVEPHFNYDSNSEVSYQITANTTELDVSQWEMAELYSDECYTDDPNDLEASKLESIKLTKYYDAAFYSAYGVTFEYSCENVVRTFERDRPYYQVNHQQAIKLDGVASGDFLINTYRNRASEGHTSAVGFWEPAIVTPNASGAIDQRFDTRSGYVDSGQLHFNDDGNLVIETNRGDDIEYFTFGADGVAVRVLGVLHRADGSLVSVGGEYAVPILRGIEIPVPADIFQAESAFALHDPAFPGTSSRFGLRYYADGTGFQVDQQSNGQVIGSSSSPYSWSDTGVMRLHRYYIDPTTYEGYSTCPEGNANCTEWRYREVEPVYFDGNYYYLRVYQEFDFCKFDGTGSCVDVSGYIARWTLSAIQ